MWDALQRACQPRHNDLSDFGLMSGYPFYMDKTFYAVISGFAVWALRELYAITQKDESKLKEATLQNTMALIELKTELKYITEALKDVHKMKGDIDMLHNKFRLLEKNNGK